MRAIITALEYVRLEPENETERIILLHWSKRNARITGDKIKDSEFLNLHIAFDNQDQKPG